MCAEKISNRNKAAYDLPNKLVLKWVRTDPLDGVGIHADKVDGPGAQRKLDACMSLPCRPVRCNTNSPVS